MNRGLVFSHVPYGLMAIFIKQQKVIGGPAYNRDLPRTHLSHLVDAKYVLGFEKPFLIINRSKSVDFRLPSASLTQYFLNLKSRQNQLRQFISQLISYKISDESSLDQQLIIIF